jgi:predicted SpoU family rRNA methylase
LIHDDATGAHRHWTAEALGAEIASFEAEYREQAVEAASNLVKRFDDEKTPQSDWI